MGNKGSAVSRAEIESVAAEAQMRPDELKALAKRFSELANKDGQIDKQRFKELVAEHYGSADSTLSSMVFSLFDSDDSAMVDFREFVHAFGFLGNRSLDDVLATSFRVLDLNNDGAISSGELRAVVTMNRRMAKFMAAKDGMNGGGVTKLTEVRLTPDETNRAHREADELFARLDADNSKKITEDEFRVVVERDEDVRALVERLLLRSAQETIVSPRKKK